jgi:hypothetical protein
LADGGISPETWATIFKNTGMWGPNKYSQFPDRIPMAGYAGPATDARGMTISGDGDYLSKLSNPGHVTTPGGYDHSANTPSVLNAFLQAHGPGGQGAGGYNNQPFFDTLNALSSGSGASGGGSGKSAAQMAQDEVDARNALPPEAPAAATPAPQGTTLSTPPPVATGGMGGSEAERQLAGWGALDPIDIGPNTLAGLDRSFGSSMATQPLGQRVQNAQAGNFGLNLPASFGGALSQGGLGSTVTPKKNVVMYAGHGDGGG